MYWLPNTNTFPTKKVMLGAEPSLILDLWVNTHLCKCPLGGAAQCDIQAEITKHMQTHKTTLGELHVHIHVCTHINTHLYSMT